MRVLTSANRRERALGREHLEWFNWVKSYVDWLIQQHREDGSFPRRWKAGSNEVAEPTGTTSYAPVSLLVMMSEETGDPKYKQSAVRAAEYVWANWGSNGLYVGGASDNPNNTDKEAGMLSMEAFLSLYESTKEAKWLERAEATADFARKLDLITARVAGSADEYLDWAVLSYTKLYNLTEDEHYLDVARVLLHDTKSMVALPGRQYDMKGIGCSRKAGAWALVAQAVVLEAIVFGCRG